MIYTFRNAGEIRSKDLERALLKAFGANPVLMKEAPEGSGAVAEIYTSTGRKHLDTLLSAKGYPKPKPYEPPPEDYTGKDDVMWDMIMKLREGQSTPLGYRLYGTPFFRRPSVVKPNRV